MTLKCGVSGEPKQKRAIQDGIDPMPIENLLNVEPAESMDRKGLKRASKKKVKKNEARHRRRIFETKSLEEYNVFSALNNAQSGISFEQLWQVVATN